MVNHDFFQDLSASPTDEMNVLKGKIRNDTCPNKIDVSAGVYRNASGNAYELPCIKMAKKVLFEQNPTHDYNFTVGIKEFNAMAAEVTFGDIVNDASIVTCQTISGTGACNLAIKFLKLNCNINDFYIGLPTWPNYSPMVESLGANVVEYNYYDPKTNTVKFDEIIQTIESAKETNACFIFQAICHNPTGTDLTTEQWENIADLMSKKKLIPILDTAYQGLSSGSLKNDSKAIKIFYEKGLQFIVCQSFSKNLGIYSERVGAIHIVTFEKQQAIVQDQIRSIIRREFSTAPAYGSRLAVLVYNEFKDQWEQDLLNIAQTLQSKRQNLFHLIKKYNVKGNYDHLLTQTGMFWLSGFPKDICRQLADVYHIYLPSNGRINVAGLNDSNLDYFVKSLKELLGEND